MRFHKDQNGYRFADERRLLKKYGSCKEKPKSLKAITISDTHGNISPEDIDRTLQIVGEYDICLLLGDHYDGDINIIMEHIPREKIWALYGNHDYNHIKKFKLNNLHNRILEVNGVKIFGVQGSYQYKENMLYGYSQDACREMLNNVPYDIDVLVTHDNRYEASGERGEAHMGLYGITELIYRKRCPLHIHGHNHRNYCRDMLNGTNEISVYGCQCVIV